VKGGDDATGGFGKRSVFDEESTPDKIGLIGFGERPVVFRGDGGGAEEFGFEIVVGEKLVDARESKLAKTRSEEMGVDVNNRNGGESVRDGGGKLGRSEKNTIIGRRKLRCGLE
jgi:hypothetical protein